MAALDIPHPFWLLCVCFDPLFSCDHAFMDENSVVSLCCYLFMKMKANEIAYNYELVSMCFWMKNC